MVGPGARGHAAPYLRSGVAFCAGGRAVDELLLLSMLAATVTIPAIAARIPSGRRALAWALLLFLAFSLAYVAAVTKVYAVHSVPEPFEP